MAKTVTIEASANTPSKPHRFLGRFADDTINQLSFLLPTILTFYIYLSTTSPTIAGGDSGELVAEGCALGTAHPPGYPLYTLIVGAVVRIAARSDDAWFGNNLKSPAYWVNVTSCVFGAISTGLISSIVFRLSDLKNDDSKGWNEPPTLLARASCAISASMLCSLSPLFWQYNKEAEVFALHNLFVSAILYVLTIYVERIVDAQARRNENDWTVVVVGAFLCGLSLTNQHTSILLIAPVVAYVFYASSIFARPKLLMVSAAAFLIGLSPYIALPILATIRPHAGSWGDVTSFSGFIHHFLRRDYGTLRLFSGDDSASEGMMARNASWAYDLTCSQLCYPWIVGFLLLGVLNQVVGLFENLTSSDSTTRHARKNKGRKPSKPQCHEVKVTNGAGIVMVFALAFYLCVFHSLSNLPLSNPLLFGIHQRFWMHSNVIAFILLGLGMHSIADKALRTSKSLSIMFSAIILLLPLSQYHRNIVSSDQSQNTHFRSYAMSILDTLPSNSLLLINYDQQWTSIRYFQECEGIRNDVQSINLSMMTYPWWKTKHRLYPNITFPGTHYTKGNTLPWANGGFTLSELFDANINTFDSNIYIGGKVNYEDHAFSEKYEEIPHGLVRRIYPRMTVTSPEAYRQTSLETWMTVSNHLSHNLPSTWKYSSLTWEWTIGREFFEHMISRSTYLLDLALKNNNGDEIVLPSIAEAAAWLELASSWDEDGMYDKAPSMSKNLGLAYMNIVRSKEEEFPIVQDIFAAGHQRRHNWWSATEENGESWKSWATIRWKAEWETFLALESAKEEPGYQQIKSIYETVMASSKGKTRSIGSH